MAKITGIDEFMPSCPIRNILSRVSDKWSMLILYTLNKKGILRFNELQTELPDISQKMLSVTLKILVEDDLVKREMFAQIPPKVEYSLTERGKSLLPHINMLIQWALENMNEIIEKRISTKK